MNDTAMPTATKRSDCRRLSWTLGSDSKRASMSAGGGEFGEASRIVVPSDGAPPRVGIAQPAPQAAAAFDRLADQRPVALRFERPRDPQPRGRAEREQQGQAERRVGRLDAECRLPAARLR